MIQLHTYIHLKWITNRNLLYSASGGGGLVAKLCPTLASSWTLTYQALLSMEFTRQEYWSGLPFPSPGNLSDPRIEARSPALQGGFFTD